MKNLKRNPKMVSVLKRRNTVISFILCLVYDTRVKEITFDTNKKNDFIITCNGIRKKFPLQTPISTIKSEIFAWISLTEGKNIKKYDRTKKSFKKKINEQFTEYTIFTELFPDKRSQKRIAI